MNSIDRLPDLARRLGLEGDPAALGQLAQFLRQVVHDLNNPMGTLGLEFYSLGLLARELEAVAEAGDAARMRQQATVLAEIQQNLQGAWQTAATILEAMDHQSARWTEGAEERE